MNLTAFLERQCGECKACCTSIGVQELGKPFQQQCVHVCSKGCNRYDNRPGSCKVYKCVWLNGDLSFDQRPDKFGVLFHVTEDEGKLWIDVFCLKVNIDIDKVMAAVGLLKAYYHDLAGFRFVRWDQQFNSAFPINLKDYPGCENIGVGTQWETRDNKLLWLKAPRRRALEVLV